jgi:hypothetical protein
MDALHSRVTVVWSCRHLCASIRYGGLIESKILSGTLPRLDLPNINVIMNPITPAATLEYQRK